MKLILVPDMHAKTILGLDYQKLKDKEIKNLMFDLDDTIVPCGVYDGIKKRENIILLFSLLVDYFNIIIVTKARNFKPEYLELLKEITKAQSIYLNTFKYNPQVFSRIVAEMGWESINTAMIGNYPNDIIAPNLSGIYTCMVSRAPRLKEELPASLIR